MNEQCKIKDCARPQLGLDEPQLLRGSFLLPSHFFTANIRETYIYWKKGKKENMGKRVEAHLQMSKI